ncbi:MAG: glucoamylase family protein [Gemmatimonadota bacterium]
MQEHIREVRASLPRGYYRELPVLSDGPLTGFPRVYEVAIALISHTEGRLELENVAPFVKAFQEVTPLTIGELWAVPALLRLGLLENVRRMALRTVQALEGVEAADEWATRILAARSEGTGALKSALDDFLERPPELSATFVSRFLYQLRLARGAFPPLLRLEQWIADEGLNAEEAVARSTQRLALTQIVMANSITSLRAIARMDWQQFVETQSAIEVVLRADPAGFYERMTFGTRDRYRHVVERIAKRTAVGEETIARRAIALAAAAVPDSSGDLRRTHVGFYLVDAGRFELEHEVGYTPDLLEHAERWMHRHPNAVFVGGIVCGTLAAIGAAFWLVGPEARRDWLAVLLFALIPASDIAVNIVNQLVTAFLPPKPLAKLDLQEDGIPVEYRTAVVIPTLFGSVSAVHEALDNLEVQYLANRGAHLHFAVLSDFTDSPTEVRAGDDEIVAAAVAGIKALNERYAGGGEDAFYLFHRPRRWNPRQGVWMGWERKRGKLSEFNRFARGDADGAFSVVVGDVEQIRTVRYVITLDADTVLPPDAAPMLIGTLAHPLNRAVFDAGPGRVVRGYGILQPRVGVSLPSAHRSHFAAIHSGHPGVDPYTMAVSDVYQDLYGEGSFTGKGIYDLDAFETATHGRFPENRLLSHDLIEGSYARAGLVTDIIVYDDYPARYLAFTRRKHRWIRGDWQLLQWLTGTVPGPDGPERNRLSLLSRWKILDNLRRSTVEIAQLALLIAGWTVLAGPPLRWTLLGLGAVVSPWVVATILALLQPPKDKSWRAYYAAVGRDAVTSCEQAALAIIFLPHQAWMSADAIVRTLWRLFVSHRRLLEWQAASLTEATLSGTPGEAWRKMAPALLISAATVAGVIATGRSTGGPSWQLVLAMLPLLLLWCISPAVAHGLSAPAIVEERRLPAAGRDAALRYALLHWRFFDRFVTAETGWLAPDNYQEDPSPVVALRTSPTNIGLQLLSTVSAHDLGFLSLDEMTRRLEHAFSSLERMQRFRGHFYNWYDLRDLSVLQPAYVSTVDSGNLAGHFLALRQACLELGGRALCDGRTWYALDAAISLAQERIGEIVAATTLTDITGRAALGAVNADLRAARTTIGDVRGSLETGAGLSRVSVSLEQAHAALDAATLPAAIRLPALEWIEWSRQLITAQGESIRSMQPPAADGVTRAGPQPSLSTIATGSATASVLLARLHALGERAHALAMEMEFGFLFDHQRKLFAIGYQQATHALDPSYYDLLASEARLASFFAIAKNDVPVEHWFRLGRTLTYAGREPALVSWSGSMFEYLMPALVMQSFPLTLLDQTYHGAIRRQISYGAEHSVPWGVSESAYNLRDRHLTYQYRAFGVPDLALKRGLGRDLVVAPYAAALAMMFDPLHALTNLTALERRGALGPYGFLDAIDFTRPEPGRSYAIVRTSMAHHIGMSLVAFANALIPDLWPRRFHADPMVRSAELLLHERIPRRLVPQEPQTARGEEPLPDPELEHPAVREIERVDTAEPHVALLGRLPYTIMVSHAGGGYSRYEDLAVTRWRSDGTRDDTGQFCYVKDLFTGRVWSAAHQPVCAEPDWYRALLATDRVTFHRADGDIETRTEITVVPEDSAEVRRVTVTNNSEVPREIELTSYGEIVLAPPEADRGHPAFSNLFVETEWHSWCTALTATRRPRAATERSLWAVHLVDASREQVGRVSYETDRAKFLGRGRTTREPVVLERDGELSNTAGAVLDPIVALRTRVLLGPGQSTSVAFTTLVATTRERAFELAGRYHDSYAAERALDLAWTSTQVELRELRLRPAEAAVYQELAAPLFYSSPAFRAPPNELRRNRGDRARLWAQGISGDWPILLATIDSVDGLRTLRQLIAAHQYWRRRGMTVDLVVINCRPASYLQELNDQISAALYSPGDPAPSERPGGAFVRRRDLLSAEDMLMLRATSRLQVVCDGRALSDVVEAVKAEFDSVEERLREGRGQRVPERNPERLSAPLLPWLRWGSEQITETSAKLVSEQTTRQIPALRPSAAAIRPSTTAEPAAMTLPPLAFDNGLGGMTEENDYLIRVTGDHLPPAPWTNVIANPLGGFLVTETGAGCTWADNAFFFRLTPWHNDPVSNPISEVIYLKDLDSGELWCPTPAPLRGNWPYTIRHGAGSTVFEHSRGSIHSRLTLAMAEGHATKLSVLRLTNTGETARRVSVTAFVEWVLGNQREHTQHQVCTSFESEYRAIFAQNFFETQFAGQVAFLSISEPVTAHTADRREFLGRNGSVSDPAGLRAGRLAGTTGAGIDPCAALQVAIHLAPGETREVVILLGAAESEIAARHTVRALSLVAPATAMVSQSVDAWTARLSAIRVRTPEPTFDAMLNRWTLYQALACRMWARMALYQSSGAYGFRDQLQDTMAFVYAEPAIAREHILRSAARQFLEGDVQHWWHPQSGRGMRTRFSDDLAWLPYVVDHYIRVVGDRSVLDEYVPFLQMRQLEPGEHEVYDLPSISEERGSVYEHCLRALRRASTRGVHGLPLMGIGDWNDGMNRVGVDGRGESVWLAWFLVTTLRGFAVHAEARGDAQVAKEFRDNADGYVAAVENEGWDGSWYRRAYFDDGTPLGSAQSDECRIDAIAQSWSIISGAGRPDRQELAMRSLEHYLVREDARLLMLLTPPFDKTPNDPGYIKGYLPGVRENGAQYTHAALWSVLATAIQGRGDRAFELFQMINPLTHASTPAEVARYKVEPYVVAADVYTAEGHLGRGGWTWYTGSASWMYRVGLESILGFTKRGDHLFISPAVPAAWPEYTIDYRYGRTTYHISVERPAQVRSGIAEILLDGAVLAEPGIPLVDDGSDHTVCVRPRT